MPGDRRMFQYDTLESSMMTKVVRLLDMMIVQHLKFHHPYNDR